MANRRLPAKLSQRTWKVLSACLKAGVRYNDAMPGGVIAVQAFGDFQNFNPQLHIIAIDGCFYGNGFWQRIWRMPFAWRSLPCSKKEGLITAFVIGNMMNWLHSGFNVYCGKALRPDNEEGSENLARYIIQASFSSERMTYIPASDTRINTAKVIYQSKNNAASKTFDALDWLAQLTTHIPYRGEQMVRYYGFYSNKLRGMRWKEGTDEEVPALIDLF